MKYRYTGHCAAGFVRFTSPTQTVTMPSGEAVDVPDWLAKKLATNSHFERADEAVSRETGSSEASDGGESSEDESETELANTPKRRGRPPKNRE